MFSNTNLMYASECDDYKKGFETGYKDGLNNPFNNSIIKSNNIDYKKGYFAGFNEGCLSVEGNTQKACENAKD